MTDEFFNNLESFKDTFSDESLDEDEGLSSSVSSWKILYEVSGLLNTHLGNFDEVLDGIIDASFTLTQADRVFLLLDRDGDLEVDIARDRSRRDIPREKQLLSQTILEKVLASERGVFIANVVDSENEISQADSIQELKILSAMCVPLKVQIRQETSIKNENRTLLPRHYDKVIGLLYVDSRSVNNDFGEETLRLLQALANHATTALLNARYHQQATCDPSTNLYNRRYFEVLLQEEIDMARRNSVPFALLMLDLQDLGAVNDKFGYKDGDEAIRQVAKILTQTTRNQDLVCRYGGDEFTIILPQTDARGARKVAQKISHSLKLNLKPDWGLDGVMGIAVHDLTDDAQKLKDKVNQSLTKAKEADLPFVLWNSGLEDAPLRADKLAGIFVGDAAVDYRNILALLETIGAVNSTMELEKLLNLIIDRIIEIADADRGILVLVEDDKYSVKIARDRSRQTLKQDFVEYSHTITRKVVESGTPVCIGDTLNESQEEPASASMLDLELRSVMCFPLSIQDQIIGAVYIDGHSSNPHFDPSYLAFFETMGNQMGLALEKARLYQKLEKKVEIQSIELKDVKEELKTKTAELVQRYHYKNIIGKSKNMQEIYRLLDKIADSEVPVLIHGESGTGKELIAKAIHFNSRRKDNPFVGENCAALNEQLLESELFGHVKGSFTGADSNKKGLFEVADGGSLFLDEMGDMSLGMQKKLLRVLQEQELRRVGDNHKIPVDVRIISATNRNLKEAMEKGSFREDLYYRLNVVSIQLPPLRDRKDDIPLLVEHFMEKIAEKTNRSIPQITREVNQIFLQYDWPGNIRELENEISKLMAMSDDVVDLSLVSTRIRDHHEFPTEIRECRTMKEIERDAICNALKMSDGNKKQAAKLLDINRKTLYNKLKKYNIELD